MPPERKRKQSYVRKPRTPYEKNLDSRRRTGWKNYYLAESELYQLYLKVRVLKDKLQARGDVNDMKDMVTGVENYITRQKLICPICYDDQKPIDGPTLALTSCGHTFHKNCLEEWIMAQHADCPYCRALIH